MPQPLCLWLPPPGPLESRRPQPWTRAMLCATPAARERRSLACLGPRVRPGGGRCCAGRGHASVTSFWTALDLNTPAPPPHRVQSRARQTRWGRAGAGRPRGQGRSPLKNRRPLGSAQARMLGRHKRGLLTTAGRPPRLAVQWQCRRGRAEGSCAGGWSGGARSPGGLGWPYSCPSKQHSSGGQAWPGPAANLSA
jgi:hypothetical protein